MLLAYIGGRIAGRRELSIAAKGRVSQVDPKEGSRADVSWGAGVSSLGH